MNLLPYEFGDLESGTYTAMLGTLVRDVRYLRTKVQINQIDHFMPGLKAQERVIQRIDHETLLTAPRSYLQEINEQLDREDAIEGLLVDDLTRCCAVIIEQLFGRPVDLANVSYHYFNETRGPNGFTILEVVGPSIGKRCNLR